LVDFVERICEGLSRDTIPDILANPKVVTGQDV
jgi:hypothetical protein